MAAACLIESSVRFGAATYPPPATHARPYIHVDVLTRGARRKCYPVRQSTRECVKQQRAHKASMAKDAAIRQRFQLIPKQHCEA